MIKTNPRIKEVKEVTFDEKATMIDMMVSSYFQENEDGGIEYTPYLEIVGQVIAVFTFLIDGVEFDKEEVIFDVVNMDHELSTLFKECFNPNTEVGAFFSSILDYVQDIVDYKKQELLAKTQNEANTFLTYKFYELIEKENERNEKELETMANMNAWIEEQREAQNMLNEAVTPEMQKKFFENFDFNDMTEAIYRKVSESDLHKKNLEIVEANRQIKDRDNKIIEMQEQFAKERQKDSVKNVVADKPKKHATKK